MDDYIKAIEDAEHKVQRMLDLLNQADQDLREVKNDLDKFYADAPKKPPRIDSVAAAIAKVDDVVAQMTRQHNELAAELASAKEEAKAQPQESDPGF